MECDLRGDVAAGEVPEGQCREDRRVDQRLDDPAVEVVTPHLAMQAALTDALAGSAGAEKRKRG